MIEQEGIGIQRGREVVGRGAELYRHENEALGEDAWEQAVEASNRYAKENMNEIHEVATAEDGERKAADFYFELEEGYDETFGESGENLE